MLHKKKTEIHFLPIWLFITSIFWFAGMMIGKLYIASSFFAFISAYIYFWHLFKLYKVKKWEKTEGIIVNHKVDKFDVENGSRGTVERYRPYYLYEYTFNGKT